MHQHSYLLEQLQQRLSAAINRSALLKVRTSKTGRQLDCQLLECVDSALPKRLLQTVIEGKNAVTCEFRLEEEPHRAIFDLLERRIRRQAELAKRETGVHALWLGYPLLYVTPRDGDAAQAILAPVLLWPLRLELNLRREGELRIRRETGAGSVRINMALRAWVRRQLGVDLPVPSDKLDWQAVKDFLALLAESFRMPPPDCEAPLDAVPVFGHSSLAEPPPLSKEAALSNAEALASPVAPLKELKELKKPKNFNAAVLGYFRWPNEAILEDLDKLKDLAQTGTIGRLLSGGPFNEPESRKAPAESERYLVYDADFSQEQAIWQARAEPGLLVHGPPGTGKSQTIVNIIADALAHEHTVLMVCQKRAALQVVFERLRTAGLEELSMLVEDTEADRLKVFRAIRSQTERLPHPKPSKPKDDFIQKSRVLLAKQITGLETALDRHAKGLHVKHPRLGIAYREILARTEQICAEFPEVRALPALQDALFDVSARELDSLCEHIKNFARLFSQADPLHNLWRYRQSGVHPSPALCADVRDIVAALRPLDEQHMQQVQNTDLFRKDELSKEKTESIPLPQEIKSFSGWSKRLLRALEEMKEATTKDGLKEKKLQAGLVRLWLKAIRPLNELALQQHLMRVEQAVELAGQTAERPLRENAQLAKLCRELGIGQLRKLEAQAGQLQRYHKHWWRFFMPGFYQAGRSVQALLNTVEKSGDVWDGAKKTEEILAYVEGCRQRARLTCTVQTLAPGLCCYELEPNKQRRFVEQVQAALQSAVWLRRQEQQNSWLTHYLDTAQTGDGKGLAMLERHMEHARQRAPRAEALLEALNRRLAAFLTPQGLMAPRQAVQAGKSILPWLAQLEQNLQKLPPLVSLDKQRRHGILRVLLEGLEEYERHRSPSLKNEGSPETCERRWEALLRFAAACGWRLRCEQDYPELLEFTPEAHAESVRHLDSLLVQKRALEAEIIRARWQRRQAPLRNRPWKRMFQLRSSKLSQAKRLREAMELSLPAGLLELRPCWLVSPETAAQLFTLQAGLFDRVIFDEASQCPVEQALPAIYRGKVLIVCGDEKQLPPTGFFTAYPGDWPENGESGDGENGDALSANTALQRFNREYLLQSEDLLQAVAGNLPECYLRVHYRSQHPALIDFSNRAFYGGLLEMPPASVDYPAIRYHAVNGCYRERRNREEAEQVLTLLKGFWSKPEELSSIGVITFNLPQRELIEDLLEKACREDSAFAARYRQQANRKHNDRDIGFFVKNLENVQGDERDVIIFSTTFGPDETGRFYRRFGPLGAMGGERRLNVAVTRARRQIIVVSSIPLENAAHQTDTELAPSAYLQRYLAYAHSPGQNFNRSLEQNFSPPLIVREVKRVLEEWGYTVRHPVGAAGFAIDLGVLHPDPHQGYLLGIDCDGAARDDARGIRIHAVWRNNLLRQRGWRLHQVWSTRWWSAKDEEIKKLKQALGA
ncbi:MAG: DUF4011 domain-containing protein [Gammaproteobacteria bacterium]|nr:DUF4011 domain-containing protein [Gammaproteobacteria bacterium]